MEPRGAVGQLHRSRAFAFEAIVPDGLNPFHAFGKFHEFNGVGIAQPQAPARATVDELVGAIPTPEILPGGWLFLDKGFLFVVLEKKETAIDGFVANADFRHIAKGMLAVFDKNILTVNQIAVDVGSLYYRCSVKDSPLVLSFAYGKAYNDTMHMRLLGGFAVPDEGSPCEIDMYSSVHQGFPKISHLFALGDGVGGDKGGMEFRVRLHQHRRLSVPARHIIHVADVFPLGAENGDQVVLLFG